MVRPIYTLIFSCAISLVVMAISLPMAAHAVTSPVVTVLNPVTQGLNSPVKVVLDASGNLYVSDPRNRGVLKFNPYGLLVQKISTSGFPLGVAIAQDGRLLVSQDSFVAMYDTVTGQETGRLSGGTFRSPNGIAVDNVTGYIYVVDSVGNEIQIYTASGLFSSKFGTRGTLAGQFSFPTGIAFETQSRQLAVVDTLNCRVQFFDVNGVFVKSIGTPTSLIGRATTPMQFGSPQAVTFEYSKDPVPVLTRMYVVDTFQGNVQVIDPAGAGTPLYIAGTLYNYIGSVGTANGQLTVPTDVVFDQKNSRLMVVNGYGNITMYGIDGGTNPFDITPPAFSIDPVPATVLVPAVTISGTVEAGASVGVTTGSTASGTVVYTSSTTWKSNITGLVAGSNVITVTAKDAAGNTAPAQSVNVTYLLPVPVVTVSSSVPGITNISNLVVTGTVDAGATVTVTNVTTSTGGAATVIDTTWSYTVALAEGMNSISVSAQKPMSGAATTVVGITLDSVAPALVVSALSDGSYTSNPVQNIAGTVKDASIVTVQVNNVPATVENGSFSVPVELVNGSNLITVVAGDMAGNVSSDSRTIFFDITKPVVAIASPMDNSFTNKSGLQILGSVDKVATITVAGMPAVVDSSNNWSAGIELAAGLNTIEVVATDLYGNTSTVKRSITLDTVNPVVAIVSPAQDIAVNSPNVTIGGSVDDSTNLTLSYSVNDTVASLPFTGGSFSFNIDFAAQGNYHVSVFATDAAGNTTTATRNVIYDTTPPALTINAATGVAPTSLSGTVEPGASVMVKEGAISIGTVTATNDTWSADLSGVNYKPELLSVVATDAAGNSSVKSLTYTFPDGDFDGDGSVTVSDALRAIRLVVNNLTPTEQELAHADIGPLLNGQPNPNGRIDLVDSILILRKAVGVQSW